MPNLIVDKILTHCLEVRLMVGQSFDNDTYYLYDVLLLNNKYTNYCNDLSIKQNLSDFIDQIQEITTMISFGMKPLGLILIEKSLQMTNLNILKKISQALNVQNFFYGTHEEMESFDLKTLKTQKAKIQIDLNLKVISFYHTRSLNFLYQSNEDHKIALNNYIKQIRSQIQSKKLLINSQLIFNDKESIQEYVNDKSIHVQILEPQSQELCNTQDQQSETPQRVTGNILLKIYSNQYITGSQIKEMLINDLEDQLNLRLNLTQADQYVLQRVEFSTDQNRISFQDFKDYQQPKINIEDKIQRNFKDYSLKNIEISDEIPRRETTKPRVHTADKNIDLPSPPRSTVQASGVTQDGVYVKEYWFLALVVLILSLGVGLKMI